MKFGLAPSQPTAESSSPEEEENEDDKELLETFSKYINTEACMETP